MVVPLRGGIRMSKGVLPCMCSNVYASARMHAHACFVPAFSLVHAPNVIRTFSHSAVSSTPNEPWWFQQDNAPQHTSHLARRWFHNHGVNLIDFPPYSPDLNPIENLWSILKARVEARLARTMDEVERVLKEEWEALDKELLTSLELISKALRSGQQFFTFRSGRSRLPRRWYVRHRPIPSFSKAGSFAKAPRDMLELL